MPFAPDSLIEQLLRSKLKKERLVSFDKVFNTEFVPMFSSKFKVKFKVRLERLVSFGNAIHILFASYSLSKLLVRHKQRAERLVSFEIASDT